MPRKKETPKKQPVFKHEAYIEDPKMCSYVIIVDEMLIIIIAMNKDDAKECKSVLGY